MWAHDVPSLQAAQLPTRHPRKYSDIGCLQLWAFWAASDPRDLSYSRDFFAAKIFMNLAPPAANRRAEHSFLCGTPAPFERALEEQTVSLSGRATALSEGGFQEKFLRGLI